MPSHTDQLLSSYIQRGEVTMVLGSTPGRTQLLFQLLAHLQQPTSPTNTDFFNIPHETGCKIGLIFASFTPRAVRIQADRAGLDIDAAICWHFADPPPNRPWDMSMMKHGWTALQEQLDYCVREGNPDVLVVDPLTNWAGVSPTQYIGVSTFVNSLVRWTRGQRCAVIGTHILNRPTKNPKEGYRLPIDRVYGNKAWTDYTQHAMVLETFNELYNEGDARQAQLTLYTANHEEQHIAVKRDLVGRWVPFNDAQKLDPHPVTDTEQTYLNVLVMWLRDQGGRISWEDLAAGVALTAFRTEETLRWIGKLAVKRGLITRTRATGWTLTPLGQSTAQQATTSQPDTDHDQTIN